MKTDLHIHTSASDGTWSPENLISNILASDIKIFAVTDHDTTENVKQIAKLAKKAGLNFIPGVEISVTHDSRNYHILGYNIDLDSEALQKILKANKISTEKMNAASISFLSKKGHSVSIDEFEAYENQKERGGWKALNYIIDKGLCQSHLDFFPLFKDIGNPFNIAKYVSPEIAISSIEKAGGIPILAHPGARFYESDYQGIIDKMVSRGVKGIECFHPDNSSEITEYSTSYCNKNQLIITGGSDCHGDFVKTRYLGNPQITLDQLNIRQLLNK